LFPRTIAFADAMASVELGVAPGSVLAMGCRCSTSAIGQ